MTITCKYCESEDQVKNGVIKGKQRYLCKDCGRTHRDGDARVKYSPQEKLNAFAWYFEGVGMRSIERRLGVSVPLLLHWLKQAGATIEAMIKEAKIPETEKDIQIIELDELYTFYEKKAKKPMCGLVLIESEIKLLMLR